MLALALGASAYVGFAGIACDVVTPPFPADPAADGPAPGLAPAVPRDASSSTDAGQGGDATPDAPSDDDVDAAPVPFGFTTSAAPGILDAVARSRSGIEACTIAPATHVADAYGRWGTGTWFNDLYFGLHGGFYVGDAFQSSVYEAELRKIAPWIVADPDHAVVPYTVGWDGQSAKYNPSPGMDMDRAAMFVLMLARTYAMTGDLQLVTDLYPAARTVVDFLAARDLDHDLLPEGRTDPFTPGTGVGAGSSISYIGDSVANTWKDFGATLFYYEALVRIASLEDHLGRTGDAATHRAKADAVKSAATTTFWNAPTGGFLAWIEQGGTRHDDWITGNNLHAVMNGLATPSEATTILATLEAHKSEIEDVVPCRSRIGIFEAGLSSNAPDYYWNGGAWTLLAAPDMMARASHGDVQGALRVAYRLANLTSSSSTGFFEAYDGVTGASNGVLGQLMDNGGFLWGLYAGVYGLDVDDDAVLVRAEVPKSALPATSRWFYRQKIIDVTWSAAQATAVRVDGVTQVPEAGSLGLRYRLVGAFAGAGAHTLEIDVSTASP